MKPRIKPLPKTGDSTAYWVEYGGLGKRIVISGCACAVRRSSPLVLLAEEIQLLVARMGPSEVSRLTAPSH